MMAMEGGYASVFKALGLSEIAAGLALGRLPMPGVTLRVPFPAAGFPPALVPIWLRSVDLQYFGYWTHFFVDRHHSIVSCAGADGWRPVEVARTVDQLFANECIHQLSTFGGPTDRIRAFAAAVGVDLDLLDRLSKEGRVENAPVAGHPLSVAMHEDIGYSGAFPDRDRPLDGASLRRTCTLEFPLERASQFAKQPDAPPWFSGANQPATFEALLRAQDFAGAWMSLNSAGWTFARAKSSLRALATAACVPALDLLAAAWCDQPHDAFVGY